MAMNMDALLRIRANVEGENNIRRLGNSMQGLEGKVKNAALATEGLRGALGDLIGLIGGGLIVAKIFGDTATLQSQARSLEVLTGNAKQAAQIVRDLQAYGNATPFESTDLIESAKRLNAFGVESNRVVEVTKHLGDVAGATGANLGELATAYGQVVAKGRLQGEELLQFQERGVALQDKLKTAYGLSGKEFQKALEGGRISAQAVEWAIQSLTSQGNKYANGAIAQSDTLNGRLSTLKDTVTGLSQTIGKVLEPALSRILLFATNIVDQINRAIKAAMSGPQNADTIAQIQAGQLPYGTAGVDKLIGERRRKQLQQAAGPGWFGLGYDQDKFIKLLQQQPEFRSNSAARNSSALPALLPSSAKAGKTAEERAAEKAIKDYNESLKRATDLAIELTRKTRDLKLETSKFGVDAREAIELNYVNAINQANDEADDLAKKTAELIQLSGGREQFQGLQNKARGYLTELAGNAEAERRQQLIDLWEQEGRAIDDTTASAWEFAKVMQYEADVMSGFRDGLNQYIEQIGTMRQAVGDLASTAFKGVEDALVSLVTTGTTNFRAFAAEILKQTARMIIQQLVLKSIMQALGSITGGFGIKGLSGATNYGGGLGASFNASAFSMPALSANGNVFAANGIVPYAMGGIVDRPTLFPFAKGIGLMGEAGPEAILPLQRGANGKLGVAGGGGTTNVVINVDAKGTKTQGDQGNAGALARDLAAVVDQRLIHHKRPGGLLSA
jgi:hypothetical protein